MLGVGATPAEAVFTQLRSGQTLSYEPVGGRAHVNPFDETFGNIDYNGGSVMPANTNYPIYWAPKGGPAFPKGYQEGINRYFEDLGADSGKNTNVDSTSTQFNDANGNFANYASAFGGAFVDENAYPPNDCPSAAICITDAQIRKELARFVTSRKLPLDLRHEYFVLTPPGVENCFGEGGLECSAGAERHTVYCAYHSNLPYLGRELIYSVDPYVTGIRGCDDGNHPNGKPSDGAIEGGLSHEHNESITDPVVPRGWTDLIGPVEKPEERGENGDKCAPQFGAPLGETVVFDEEKKEIVKAKYNQEINGHFYWHQEEWSNQGHICLQRFTFAGKKPTATFKSKPEGGLEVTFDAKESTAPGGVFRYNWQFNDARGGFPSFPVETAGPVVRRTFPAAGIYVVALTVFAADGTSIGTAQQIEVGKAPAPRVTRVPPGRGPATGGTNVTIRGTSFTGATEVKFGATPAAPFTVDSANSITVASPPGAPGVVDVTVTAPGGTSATSPGDHFKYK